MGRHQSRYFRILTCVLFAVLITTLLFPAFIEADSAPPVTLQIHVSTSDHISIQYLDLLVPRTYSGIKDSDAQGYYARNNPSILDQPLYLFDDGERVALLCHGVSAYGSIQVFYAEDESNLGGSIVINGEIPDDFAVIAQEEGTRRLLISNTVHRTSMYTYAEYDPVTNHLSARPIEAGYPIFGTIVLLALIAFYAFMTTVIESLLVLPFRFPRRRWLPIPVNIFTQCILNVGMFLLFPNLFRLEYWMMLAIFEIAIVIIEFLIYFFFMGNRRFWKTFAYTISVNAASFASGFLVLYLLQKS